MTTLPKNVLIVILMFFFVQSFAQTYHSNIKDVIRRNEKGFVKAIYNIDFLSSYSTPEETALEFLNSRKDILGTKTNFDDLKLINTYKSHETKHVMFKQYYKGMEIMGSDMVVSINSMNNVTMLVNGYLPNIEIDVSASITNSMAENIASDYRRELEINEGVSLISNLKLYVDKNDNVRLVYIVDFIRDSLINVGLIILDAHTGQVIKKVFDNSGFVTGSGKVFSPDPGTHYRRIDLTYESNVDGAYDNLSLTNLNNPINGIYYVQGKYARSHDLYYPNFTPVTRADLNFLYNKTDHGFSEVNIYHFINTMRNYVGSLGFTPIWKYQGEEFQWIAYDAHASASLGDLNCYYKNYPDNQSEVLWFGYRDNEILWSHDQSIIIHEYGHALHDALLNGGYTYADMLNYPNLQGISEGIGDYLAISFRRTLTNGDYRPNEASNYAAPTARTSIKEASLANYSLWNYGGSYYKGSIWASTIMDLEYNDGTNPSSGSNLGRSVTTKLLLKSLSYVSATSTPIDYVNAIMQADRDLYNGSHLYTIEQVFRNRGFFSGYEVNGTISTNTTWSDYRVVTGNVTIVSGVTLTILPNTFIYFDSGKYLSVNGNINATSSMFTSSSSSTYWGGIVFNSGSQGNLDGCTINRVQTYGGGAIVINNASPTIQSCTIENNVSATSGIQILSNGSPYIYNNIIRNNTYHGILIEHANGYLRYNMITSSTNNMASVYCNNFANPLFGGVGGGLSEGKNTLQNGYYGLYANYYSMPSAGAVDIAYNNRFINNSYANVYASNNSSIYARYDWWGQTPPDQNKIIAVSGSNIYWDQYLTTDPGPSRSIHFTPQDYNKSLPYYSVQSINVPTLLEARELRFNKQYEQAINIYKAIIADKSNLENVKIALVEIGNTYKECNDSTLIDYLNDMGIIKGNNPLLRPLALSVLENIYSYSGNINKAIDFNNVIIRDYPETDHAYYAHLNLSFLYYNKEEYDKAQSVINEFNSKYSLTDHYQPIEWLLSIKTDNKNRLLGDFSLNQKVNKKTVEKVILFENYPNPFNPSTKISFTLISKENVKLKVFDILGREVALLIDKELETGKHEIEFDASELPSGVYFYNLTTSTNSFTKKMLLIK